MDHQNEYSYVSGFFSFRYFQLKKTYIIIYLKT